MRKLLIRLLFTVLFLQLAACSQPVTIRKPFDVSKANQSSTAQFTVKKTGDYLFGLMFTTGKNFHEIEKLEEIYGNFNKDGIPIDIHLIIHRDNKIICNQLITTTGTQWIQGFQINGKFVTAQVRLIRLVELKPGNYIIEIKTANDTNEFKGIESYSEFTFYKPKH